MREAVAAIKVQLEIAVAQTIAKHETKDEKHDASDDEWDGGCDLGWGRAFLRGNRPPFRQSDPGGEQRGVCLGVTEFPVRNLHVLGRM